MHTARLCSRGRSSPWPITSGRLLMQTRAGGRKCRRMWYSEAGAGFLTSERLRPQPAPCRRRRSFHTIVPFPQRKSPDPESLKHSATEAAGGVWRLPHTVSEMAVDFPTPQRSSHCPAEPVLPAPRQWCRGRHPVSLQTLADLRMLRTEAPCAGRG